MCVWKCSADWRVKYGDFGLANKHGNNTMITGSKRGHEDYEPPVRGDLSQVGTRRAHDMWAVGCVVAEMVLKQTVTELGVKCPRNSEGACAQFIARVVERDPEIGSIVERLLTWEHEDRMDAVDFREAVLQVVGSAEECKRQQMQAQLQIPLGSSKSKSVSEALHTHRASRLREAEFRSRKLSWPGSMPAIAEEKEENHHQQQRALSTGSTNSSAMLSEQSLEDTTPSLVPSARSTDEQDSFLSSVRRRRQQTVTWDRAETEKANDRFDDGSATKLNRSVKHMQHFALSRAFLQWQKAHQNQRSDKAVAQSSDSKRLLVSRTHVEPEPETAQRLLPDVASKYTREFKMADKGEFFAFMHAAYSSCLLDMERDGVCAMQFVGCCRQGWRRESD